MHAHVCSEFSIHILVQHTAAIARVPEVFEKFHMEVFKTVPIVATIKNPFRFSPHRAPVEDTTKRYCYTGISPQELDTKELMEFCREIPGVCGVWIELTDIPMQNA